MRYYYLITKRNPIKKLTKKIKFIGGYSFNHKLKINLYEKNIIHYILITKLNNSLKKIINIYLLYEDEEDTDTRNDIILPKVESLRKILIESYAYYLTEGEIESYLTKLDKLESKLFSNKKSKSR